MNPDYEGTFRLDATDLKGEYYIQNLINAADDGTQYTEFYFTKPEEDGMFQKRAYIVKFEPYSWYISAGEVYSMSRTLAEGAPGQAGIIEELSVSLDEISAPVEKNT